MTKTYIVLWEELHELKINVFGTYGSAKHYKKLLKELNGNTKIKIVRVNFPVCKW